MYGIFDKSSGELVYSGEALTTPQLAWQHFDSDSSATLKLPDGSLAPDFDQPQHFRQFYECKLIGTRTPVLRVPGHQLTLITSPPSATCLCGWSSGGKSPAEARRKYREHLESLPHVDLVSKPAENLDPAARVAKSLEVLKASGGARKTFRLNHSALEELDTMVATGPYPNHTAAVESLILGNTKPADYRLPVYARHVDDADVMAVVENAVSNLCENLDVLFPDAPPEGGRGISSNFQGLLVDHIKAMLAGRSDAGRSHSTHLPKLLATYDVFGKPFVLPKTPGAGYLIYHLESLKVLSAYSGAFMQASQRGELLSFGGQDADVLFSDYEGATEAGLKALRDIGESPQTFRLLIVAAHYEDTGAYDGFRVIAE